MIKTMLIAAAAMGIWSAPFAYAEPQDQVFLSYLAAHNVAVDTNTAINAAHIACAQIADGESPSAVDEIVSQQVPAIKPNQYWIVAGARKAYCPT
jgi:hypothetical protein